MGTSKSRFSNIICILFSIYLVALLDLFVNKRFAIGNWVSNAIITGVVCAFFVGISFLLNKYVSIIFNKLSFDEDKAFYIGFSIASLAFLVIRLLIIADVIKIEPNLSVVSDMAMIKDGSLFVNFSTTDGIFATMLSLLFKILGNTFFPVYLLQLILSIITYALLVFGFKDLFGRFVALFTAFFMAFSPTVFNSIACDSSVNLIFMFFAVIIFVTAKYRKRTDIYDLKAIISLLIGALCGICGLYHVFFLYVILVPIIVVLEVDTESLGTRVLNTLMVILGGLLGFVIPQAIDAFVISKTGVIGFTDSVVNNVLFRFGLKYDFDILAEYIGYSKVFILLSLCVIYCVMYWLNEEDDLHVLCTMLLTMLLQIACNSIVNNDAFMICINVCLVAIAAYGIKSLAFERETYRIVKSEDDMQPLEIESINNKAINISTNSSINDAAKRVAEKFEDTSANVENKSNDAFVNKVEETTINEDKSVEVNEAKEEVIAIKEAFMPATPAVEEDFTPDNNDSNNEIKEINEIIDKESSEEIDLSENILPEVNDDVIEEADQEVYVSKLKDDFDSLGADSLITTPSQELIDFERMFSTGITNLPPGVKLSDDLLTDEIEEEVSKETIENIDDIPDVPVNEEPKETQGSVMANQFFDYLFKDIPDPDPIVDEKVEESFEEKVNRYADLDIDLGTDAFNYIPPTEDLFVMNDKSNDIFESKTSIETNFGNDSAEDINSIDSEDLREETKLQEKVETIDEFSFIEIEETLEEPEKVQLVKEVNLFDEFNETIEDNSLVHNEENLSNELISEIKNISKINSVEDALKLKIVNEELEEAKDNLSVEDLIETKLLVEDAIIEKEEAKKEASLEKVDERSIEDIINEKLDIEENTSIQEEIENKLDIEENTSIEEIINEKLDIEENTSIEEMLNDKLNLEEWNAEYGISETNDTLDLDHNGIPDVIDSIFASAMLETAKEDGAVTDTKSLDSDDSFFDENTSLFEETEVSDELSINADTVSDELIINDATVSNDFVFEDIVSEKFVSENNTPDDFIFEDNISQNDLSKDNVTEDIIIEQESYISDDLVIDDLNDFSEEILINDLSSFDELKLADELDNVQEEIFVLDNTNEWDQIVNYDNISIGESETDISNDKLIEESEIKAINDVLVDETDIEQNTKGHKDIEYIENPLPLPKKHVHRDMDYGRSIPDIWMHYDIEIDSSNDFYDV